MQRTNPLITLILSALSALAIVLGVYAALHSPLFMVEVVEVAGPVEGSPLDSRSISELAAVPIGEVSLFDLNLQSIEKRLLSNPWIKGVVLTKRFPQTLAVQITFREPVALYQSPAGSLQYVERDGNLFGPFSLQSRPDLPVISGVEPAALARAAALLQAWAGHGWTGANQVSQLDFDPEEGFRLWITFAPAYRVQVTLGQEIDEVVLPETLSRVDAVLHYIRRKQIPARQVYADTNKKIVVRTVRGS